MREENETHIYALRWEYETKVQAINNETDVNINALPIVFSATGNKKKEERPNEKGHLFDITKDVGCDNGYEWCTYRNENKSSRREHPVEIGDTVKR